MQLGSALFDGAGGVAMALADWRFAVAIVFTVTPGIAAAADMPPPPPSAPAATYTPATPASEWLVSVGAVGQVGPAWPGAPFRDMTIWGYPIIDIHKPGTLPDFFGGRDSFGFSLVNLGQFKFGLVGKYVSERREASYAGLTGLGDVNYAVQLGGFAEFWAVPWLRLRGEVRQGFGGEKGITGDLFLDAVATAGQFRFAAGPRLTLQSSAAVTPYFSVTPTQSALSGLPVYNASGGFYSYGVGGQVDYFLNQQWATYALVEYERISGSAANSPIVTARGSPDQFTFGLGATYSFSMRPLW
jgi:MipA family protein